MNPSTVSPPDYPLRSNKDLQLLHLLVAHYCHHDNLFWSRISFVFYLQAAALGGAWALRHKDTLGMAIALLLLAFFMTVIWLFIFNRDLQARDQNKELIAEVAARVQGNLGLERRFGIGGPVAALKALDADYKGSLWKRALGLFDSGIFLQVPARAIILMRMAITLVVLIDVVFVCFLLLRPQS